MSTRTKEKIVAIIAFISFFLLWAYVNTVNYKLNAQNSRNIQVIADQLGIDQTKIVELQD